jgi:1-phosphofructokinase
VIVSLTANPSTDRTIGLAGALERGSVQRTLAVTDQSGGKGVNISRAAVAAGLETVAVLPVLRDSAFAADVRRAGIAVRAVEAGAEVRVNLTLTEPDGTTTKLNSPGTPVREDLLAELADAVAGLAETAEWVVLAGSLPPGAPDHWYSDLVGKLAGTPALVAVDTSEAPLVALVDRLSDAAPDLMKPNGEELASFTGADADALEADPEAAAAAAATLVERGVGAVLATLGANGAVLVTADGAWHAAPPPTTVVSTVGAGDSSLFGYLLGQHRGLTPDQSLALAVAYGSAAAGLPGTTIPQPTQAHPELVAVRRLAFTRGG